MALFSERNIKKVFIGAAIDRSSGVIAGALATPELLADGEIVVTDMSNVILDTVTVLGKPMIKIIQGRTTAKDPSFRQEVLRLDEVVNYTGDAYSAAVEQVTYVGYNGTSGSIEVIPNNLYFLRISRITNTFVRGGQFIGKYGQFNSTSSSTQFQITDGLVKNLVANFQPEYKLEKDICFELVSSGADSTMTGPTSFTFTKGSKTVTYVGTDPTGPSVGDFLRAGTGTTSAVYKITAISTSANTITLDMAFQNETKTSLLAAVKYVTAAAAAAGNWGIKQSGRPMKFDILRWGQYDKLRWNVTLDGFGATEITFTTAASEGAGVFELVASDETLSWGKEGQAFIVQTPPLIREQDSSSTGTYSCLNVGFRNKVEHMVGAGEHFGNIISYLNNPISGSTNYTGDAVGANSTSFVDVLDAYIAQNPNFSAQVSNL